MVAPKRMIEKLLTFVNMLDESFFLLMTFWGWKKLPGHQKNGSEIMGEGLAGVDRIILNKFLRNKSGQHWSNLKGKKQIRA